MALEMIRNITTNGHQLAFRKQNFEFRATLMFIIFLEDTKTRNTDIIKLGISAVAPNTSMVRQLGMT